MKSILTTSEIWRNPCERSSANLSFLFWHLLAHLLQTVAVPITQGLFYGETMWCNMPGASACGSFFFQRTSSIFKHEKLCERCQKSSLTNTFYILWVSLVFVWPSTYALTYGINKYYKCSQFMPSCEAHTMGCKLLWDNSLYRQPESSSFGQLLTVFNSKWVLDGFSAIQSGTRPRIQALSFLICVAAVKGTLVLVSLLLFHGCKILCLKVSC